ncbi:MAG: MFS transporter [Actinomycetota bacterium]|nr:MFS transporter [Actinomycetota bacterium]
MLLYPVYALLFAQAGLSTAQISSLLAIWSVTSFILEIPSGVWADATSRRLLLVAGPLLQAAGYALWIIAPSYPAFAVGFALWGVAGALQSGALEALVYEELDRVGAAARYPHVIGRATAIGTVAATLAIGLAAPVFAAGGYTAVGVASVLACLAGAAIAATFPEHRAAVVSDGVSGLRAYAAVLKAGVAEVRSGPALRGALALVPAVTAIWGALDEYLPLLATDTGVADETVPLLFLLVYIGVAAGGLLGGPASRLSRRALAGLLAAAATGLALGALSGLPAGFVGIAAAFCAFQALQVVVDTRLQDAIRGPARSTVTSLAGLATELLVLAVFAGYGAGSALAGDATLFACFAGVYVVIAAAMLRAEPSRRSRRRTRPLGRSHRRVG